jgi:hypothetical protein
LFIEQQIAITQNDRVYITIEEAVGGNDHGVLTSVIIFLKIMRKTSEYSTRILCLQV